MEGLHALQDKLNCFADQVKRIRVEMLEKYGKKIEKEAKEACPDEQKRETVKITFSHSHNFEVNYGSEAKPYVDPVILRNIDEMNRDVERRIVEAWRA